MTDRAYVIRLYGKNLKEFYDSFSRNVYTLNKWHLLAWTNFNFLHTSQWMNFPQQSSLFFTPSVQVCGISLLLIYRLIFVSAWHTFAILLRIISFRSYRIGRYNVVMLLQEFKILSWDISFLAMSRTSRVQYRQFFSWNIRTVLFPYFSFQVCVVVFSVCSYIT